MGRRKGSLNKSTLAKMGLDKYKIDHQNDGKNGQNNHQNDGKPKRIRRTKSELIAEGYYDKNKDKPKPKAKVDKIRVRRTKAQLIADGYYDNKNKGEKEKNVQTAKVKDNCQLFTSSGMSVDQVSEKAIKKAKEQGKENWEQDFRNDYEQGQKIYYVEINDLCHTKELLELYIGTVYSKIMIAWVDRGEAHTIGIEDTDKIFREEKEAKKYYQKVRVK